MMWGQLLKGEGDTSEEGWQHPAPQGVVILHCDPLSTALRLISLACSKDALFYNQLFHPQGLAHLPFLPASYIWLGLWPLEQHSQWQPLQTPHRSYVINTDERNENAHEITRLDMKKAGKERLERSSKGPVSAHSREHFSHRPRLVARKDGPMGCRGWLLWLHVLQC